MAFFPRNFYNNTASASDSSFTPLFRLLDDFDNYSRQGQGQAHGRRTAVPTWQPKFDVRETADAYELHGELPGMGKDNVRIEFTDPQTMLVRGKVERNYTAGTSPSGYLEDISVRGAITGASTEQRRDSRQATVEDEPEAQASESEQQIVSNNEEETAPPTQQNVDRAKYWLTERSIGEFTRSFSFPTRVEQEAVNANLKEGVLSVTVPKAKKHEPRHITIN